MPAIPPQLYVRVVTIIVTSILGAVGPLILQDRPGLKWVFDRTQGRIVQRVVDKVPNPFEAPAEHPVPDRFDDGIKVPYQACINPHSAPVRPVVNPNGYCRRHWWTAGPVRAIVSAPVRFLRSFRFGGCR